MHPTEYEKKTRTNNNASSYNTRQECKERKQKREKKNRERE